MLKKLRAKAGRVATKIVGLNNAIGAARGRHRHFRGIAKKKWDKAVELRAEADKLRKKHPAEAAILNAKAAKLEAQSEHAHIKAEHVVGRIKRLIQERDDLEATEERLKARIKKLAPKCQVKGNKVIGGSWEKRLQTAMLTSAARCKKGERHNFYSQTGTFDAKHCITGPASTHRDDCSSWFGSVYWTANMPDPHRANWGSGFTGTLVAHGTQISREEARHTPGAAVIYGSGNGHHVEMAIGDGTEHTIGHGSDPVDMGVFDLFGPGEVMRFYKFDHTYKLAA